MYAISPTATTSVSSDSTMPLSWTLAVHTSWLSAPAANEAVVTEKIVITRTRTAKNIFFKFTALTS